MKKFILFLTLTCAAIAQVTIDWNDIVGEPTMPAGTIVGTTDSQVLTNKDLSGASNVYRAATTSAIGAVELATNAETLAGTDTTRAITPAGWSSSAAAIRNALASRGGVVFDGSAGAKIVIPLTSQSMLAENFSVSIVFRCPTANPTALLPLFSISQSYTITAVNDNLFCRFHTNGDLLIGSYKDVTQNTYGTGIAGFLAAYAGKTVHLVFVKDSTGWRAYVNSVVAALTTPTASGTGTAGNSLATNFLTLGTDDSGSRVFNSTVSAVTFYNLALSAADVQDIYELGGGVPERFKFGSQANRQTNSGYESFTGTPDDGAGDTFSGWTVQASLGRVEATQTGLRAGTSGTTGVKITRTATGANNSCRIHTSGGSNAAAVGGRIYRFRVWTKGDGINDCRVEGFAEGAGVLFLASTFVGNSAATWARYETTVTLPVGTTGVQLTLEPANVLNAVSQIDDFEMLQLGAVLHLDGDSDGLGYQWHDQSTNKLDALLTTTGVTWTKPQRRGYVRGTATWTATHEPKSLLGQRAFPDGVVVDTITYDASAGSSGSGLTLGTTATAARWVALDTYTTAKEVGTLAARLPAGTAANDHDLVADPDTANYTGTLTLEAHYTVTEGL